MARPKMLGAVHRYWAPLGNARSDAVGPLDVLSPDATQPDSPMPELCGFVGLSAMINHNAVFVAQQDHIVHRPDERVETIEFCLGQSDESLQRFTTIPQFAHCQD